MEWRIPVGSAREIRALVRESQIPVARFAVVLVPGSGCAGLGPIASQYFDSLRTARVLVLHKPGVDPAAWPPPAYCGRRFVLEDSLEEWAKAAKIALHRAISGPLSGLPIVLVGVSEGAELLPTLSDQLPGLVGMVLISSAGLDPVELAKLSSRSRLGRLELEKIISAAAGTRPNSAVLYGRSLGYWRSMLSWRVELPLARSPVPVLQAWGGSDPLVPTMAVDRLATARRQLGGGPYCRMTWSDADHGLQEHDADHIQDVWRALERWAETSLWDCEHLTRGLGGR